MVKEGLRGVAVPEGLGTSSGGRGALPNWWSVLKEGLRGVAVPNGPGTPALGTGSHAQAVVDAQGGLVGRSSSQ